MTKMTKTVERTVSFLVAFVIVLSLFSFVPLALEVQNDDVFTLNGNLCATDVSVRSGPGTTYSRLTNKLGTRIALYTPDSFVAEDKEYPDPGTDPFWYHIKFIYNDGNEYEGYIRSDFVTIKRIEEPKTEEQTTEEKTTDEPITPEQFEKMIELFPDDYKSSLRVLHEKHPNWTFVPYITGFDWNYVQSNENIAYRSLINSKILSYRSIADGCYVWTEDYYVPKEGSSWFQADPQVVAYYMDPRNFLNENNIFMFEKLSYDPSVQTINGVRSMLKGSFMENATIKNLDGQDVSYAEAFMEAARIGNVSPYHLVARCIQEVGRSGNAVGTCGDYVTSGGNYTGYYNFFNIGASTGAEGGMIYSMKTGDGKDYRPWNSQYKAILGGAVFLSSGYIDKGQDTLYYQKYNVTTYRSFSHQYMTNVQAAYSESTTMRKNYVNMDLMNTPFVFSIPTFVNIPSSPCALPAEMGSPNNWLKSLSVEGFELTPTFDINKNDQNYTLVIKSKVDTIKINAETVSLTATVTGNGIRDLVKGENDFVITCTSSRGTTRNYNIKVVLDYIDDDTPSGYTKTFETTPDGILYGLNLGTSIESFIESLKLYGRATCEVQNRLGQKIDSGLMSTGYSVIIYDGKQELKFLVLVRGDANSDGKISVVDIQVAVNIMLNISTFDKISNAAADVNNDGKVSVSDIQMLCNHILSIKSIDQ